MMTRPFSFLPAYLAHSRTCAQRLDKLRMRQHVMLAGRGSSSVGGRARWRVGLAMAPSSSQGTAPDEEGGVMGATAEDEGPRPSLPQVASIERASQKVEFVTGAVERHIEECSQQSMPHMAVLGPLPSSIASPKAVWR